MRVITAFHSEVHKTFTAEDSDTKIDHGGMEGTRFHSHSPVTNAACNIICQFYEMESFVCWHKYSHSQEALILQSNPIFVCS